MVSKFREFLNMSPQPELVALRESFPRQGYPLGRRPRNNTPIPQQGADAEGFDEEVADEDNDFEGMDGSEMAVDQGTNALPPLNPNALAPANLPPLGQAIGPPPPPPPPPMIEQQPFNLEHGHPPPHHFLNQPPPPMNSLAFSSFMRNETATGSPPLSAIGHAQASMASVGQGSRSRQASSTMGYGNAPGASTAPMHQARDEDETDDTPNSNTPE